MADLKLFPKMAGLTSCPKVYLSLPRYNPPCQVSTHDFGQIRHDRQSLEQCFRHESDLWVGQIFSTLGNLVSVNDKFRRISEMSPDGVLTRIDFFFVKKKCCNQPKLEFEYLTRSAVVLAYRKCPWVNHRHVRPLPFLVHTPILPLNINANPTSF